MPCSAHERQCFQFHSLTLTRKSKTDLAICFLGINRRNRQSSKKLYNKAEEKEICKDKDSEFKDVIKC